MEVYEHIMKTKVVENHMLNEQEKEGLYQVLTRTRKCLITDKVNVTATHTCLKSLTKHFLIISAAPCLYHWLTQLLKTYKTLNNLKKKKKMVVKWIKEDELYKPVMHTMT